MPTLAEIDAEIARRSPSLADIDAEIARRQGASEPDYPLAGVIEPAAAVASGIASTVAGGLAGGAQEIFSNGGADTVKNIQEAGTFQPRTEIGKERLTTLNDLVQKGIDIVNYPISGIGGLLELVSGQGIDAAVDTIKNIQNMGVSKVAGDKTFEATGSPLAATIAETAPEAIASALGFQGGRKAAKPIKDTAKGIWEYQTPGKQRIAQMLEKGSIDIETAKFDLKPESLRQLPAPGKTTKLPPKTKLEQALNIGGPRVEKSKPAVEAIRQGFDEAVIAAVKGSSPADKHKFLQMVSIAEKTKKNAKFGMENRAGQIAGDSLLDRFKVIQSAKKSAGERLDGIANRLKGKPIDISKPIESFSNSLDDFGIKFADDGKGGLKPDFSLSQLSPGDRGPLKEVIRQMNIQGKNGIDGLTAHRMKRIIDNNVTFGKVKTGMSGDAERVLKKFRFDIDSELDRKFPAYDKVNSQYSETVGVVNAIQDVAGRKLDLSGPNADKAVGVLLRRIMSNAQSRIPLIDSINDIEKISRKYGYSKKDDLMTQVLFADELDRVFKTAPRTSLQGQEIQAIEGAASATVSPDIAVFKTAGKVADKMKGVNEAGAFKAIKDLLNDSRKSN